MAISVVAGFLVGAFNPYITNTVIKHNPVYPLIGEDKIDIMSIVTPQNIEGKCVFYQPILIAVIVAEWVMTVSSR